jgi:hypothetical protein
MACLFFILFTNLAFAKILKDEVLYIGTEEFSFQYVCKKMIKKDSPLIDIYNILTLDCMSRKVKVYQFCFDELASSPYYIRAVIDKDKKKVICKKGKKVTLKLTCDSEGVDCKDSEIACFKIQERYAARLALNHHSTFKENDRDVLNCYFSTKAKISLPD